MMKAPSFYLTAIGAARIIGGPPGPGTLLLLIFHGHTGADTAFAINSAVRSRWPDVEQLMVVSVVDLHHIPRFMRPAVELTLAAAYRQAAKRIPENLDPTQYVIILPDWEGKVTTTFEMRDRVEDIGLILLTKHWEIFANYSGPNPIEVAFKIVDDAISAESDPALNSHEPL